MDFDVGYLVSSLTKSNMKSFKMRTRFAEKLNIRLCLIELTEKNFASITQKGKIDVRVWKRNSLEEISIVIPKIIYDRTEVSRLSSKTELLIEALLYAGCTFLNSREIRAFARDKWAQFKFFYVRGILVPKTAKYDLRELERFIKTGTVFIKPRSGSQGKNQIIIKRNGENSNFFTVYTTFGRKKKVILEGVSAVEGFLSEPRFFLHSYIMQEGVKIDYIEEETESGLRKRSFDFRVIVQRGATGKPCAVIVFVRVGPPSSEQANISQGGHPQDPEMVFENHNEVVSRLRQQSIEAFNMLAEKFELSEMAFDFVQDIKGQYWLIEVNSRPGTSGPRTLSEWVPTDTIYRHKGVILFDENYTNQHRKKWGARFYVFRMLPFYYTKYLMREKK